jgi:selenocysteine lyase/cysteine desulfurase
VLESDLEPLFLDMRGADWIAADTYRPAADARRFESWEFAWALVLATGEAARYATAIGLEAIRERSWALAAQLREKLSAIDGVRVLDRGETRCAIVTLAIEGRDPAQVMRALRERRINTTAQIREHALLDFDDKDVAASLRLSPHYYNTEEELDRAVTALRDCIADPDPAR